jgi:hypothetical protein
MTAENVSKRLMERNHQRRKDFCEMAHITVSPATISFNDKLYSPRRQQFVYKGSKLSD